MTKIRDSGCATSNVIEFQLFDTIFDFDHETRLRASKTLAADLGISISIRNLYMTK